MAVTIVPDTAILINLGNPPGSTTTTVGGTVVTLPTISNSKNILIYSKGGGSFFPSMLNDTVLEPGLYHGGNPLLVDEFKLQSYENLDITVEKKDVFSTQRERGIFDIDYPNTGAAKGRIQYYWNSVFTSPLGIYTKQPSLSDWNFTITNEVAIMQTNDVNVIPREEDYIVFNYVPIYFSGYTNGSLPVRLPYFKGTETYVAQIKEVLITGGTGTDVTYQLTLDKSFSFNNGDRFAITLLNRTNTSIQKELFFTTFEQTEVHRQQLLGDPYNNQTNTALPTGRMNYIDYGGHEFLGMQNLLKGIINSTTTPFVVFDVNDEVKDRISYKANSYDTDGKPVDTHFEFHLPYVMLNDNLYSPVGGSPASPVDGTGNILENIFVTNPNPAAIINDSNIGRYTGLYLKYDTSFTKRFGWLFHDLRVIVIDDAELATALGYNSNRNYTLPAPKFQSGSGNSLTNPGIGTNLNITDATNTSPIVITTSTPYSLPRGAQISISGILGNTHANGTYYIDAVYGSPDIYKFELWQQMPQYVGGVRVPGTGIPVAGNGIFVNNGVGRSGKVIGALPPYSYFYTYRIRNKRNNSTSPYATTTDFNFALAGSVDNSQGSLFVNIPMFNWYNQQSNLVSHDLGFQMFANTEDVGYGIDLIIGQYDTNPLDPINPMAIIGIKNIMCIPISELNNPFVGNPAIGFTIELKKAQDYDRTVSETLAHTNDYTFDLLNNMPVYSYSLGTLSSTLLTGKGIWTIGNLIYRNHSEINRAYFSIRVPAESWNDSTNPSYTPTLNPFIKDKYITEVALLLDEDEGGNNDLAPMIYAKIAPAIKKTQDLDVMIQLSVDF